MDTELLEFAKEFKAWQKNFRGDVFDLIEKMVEIYLIVAMVKNKIPEMSPEIKVRVLARAFEDAKALEKSWGANTKLSDKLFF